MSVMYTATGRVFSAHLPPQTVEKMITRELADDDVAGHQKKRPAKEALAEMFEEVRRKGLARTIGQPVEGINAMSAPVFNQSRNIELAVTAIGPKGSFDAAWDGQIAEELRACAYKISSRLGYRA